MEKKVAYSQHQFSTKKSMLTTSLGLPEDISHPSVLALEVISQEFSPRG